MSKQMIPIEEKKRRGSYRPSIDGDREVVVKGLDVAKYPAPEYFTQEHKTIWNDQLKLFAPTLREIDFLTFEVYITTHIDYKTVQKELYLLRQEEVDSTNVELYQRHTNRLQELKGELSRLSSLLMKLLDKLCANPYNRARIPEVLNNDKQSVGDVVAKMFE